MNNTLAQIQDMIKAIEAGGYNAAPSSLVQGSALQREDLSPVLENVTYGDRHIVLQKYLRVESVKTTLVQFDRQLSYGQGFNGFAQFEGNVGQEQTSDYVRVVVPMVFLSHIRRVTVAATLVDTVDGKKADERAAADAALHLAGAGELQLFRGKADFSNAGVFDGNPLVIPTISPDMVGLDLQIRQSDNERNAHDLMMNEFGSDQSVVIPGGTHLTQENIEDAATRSRMNMGNADHLFVDPIAQSNYNKLYLGGAGVSAASSNTIQRIMLAGQAQNASGADLRKQWVSNGEVSLEASRFLSGKTTGAPQINGGPLPPASVTPADGVAAGTTFVAGDLYWYAASAQNENGESALVLAAAQFAVVTSGHSTTVTIAPSAGIVRFYNLYRSPANGPVKSMKFIGRVISATAGSTVFTDLNNKSPGAINCFLVQDDTMSIAELAPFSRIKLAITDLSMPEAYYRFLSLKVTQPRKNVIIDDVI